MTDDTQGTPVAELTSSDSTHSTYEAADDLPETNPPMGPQVIETRGLPGGAEAKKGGRSSAKETAS